MKFELMTKGRIFQWKQEWLSYKSIKTLKNSISYIFFSFIKINPNLIEDFHSSVRPPNHQSVKKIEVYHFTNSLFLRVYLNDCFFSSTLTYHWRRIFWNFVDNVPIIKEALSTCIMSGGLFTEYLPFPLKYIENIV